jgi:eukaryotic-like serine/threonine-protein kinase
MPTIGEQLAGRYRIDGQLGTGGMATVFRGHDLRLGRDVAIKLLLPHLAGDPIIAERFDREARSLATLNHPNVVAVFDVEPGNPESKVEPFFVMELCDGGSLADLMATSRRIAPDELVPIVADVSEGLAAIHDAGLLHRDVKPHNVLMAGGRAKLGDLGLARPEEAVAQTSLTAAGTALGTLAYLAPERLAGVPATAAADVWSLGALAFQGLTGTLPRPTTTIAELVDRRLDAPPLVSTTAPDLGPAFDEPVAAALDPEPSRRPLPLAFSSGLVAGLGRWSRDGGPARWMSAMQALDEDPVTSIGSVDSAMTTSVAIPLVRSEGPSGDAPGGRARSAPSRSRSVVWLVVVGIIAIALGGLFALAGFGGVGGSAGSPSPSAGLTATPSAVGASPSPSSSAGPSPKPTADRFAPAIARLADLRDAIAAASGGHGIKGHEANELQGLLTNEQGALDSHDAGGARATADQLVQAIKDDIESDKINKDQAQALVDAAQALRKAVAGL